MNSDFALDVGDKIQTPFDLSEFKTNNKKITEEFEEELRQGKGGGIEVDNNDVHLSDSDNEEVEDYMDAIEKEIDANYERYKKKQQDFEPLSVQQRRMQLHAERKAKMNKKALEMMSEQDFQKAMEDAERDAYEKGLKQKLLRKQLEESGGDENNNKRQNSTISLKERSARWFSQQLFTGEDIDDNDELMADIEDNSDTIKNNNNVIKKRNSQELDLIEGAVPLPSQTTDKAIRHQQRLKSMAKTEKKEEKKKQLHLKNSMMFDAMPMSNSSKIEVVKSFNNFEQDDNNDEDDDDSNLDPEEKQKRNENRKDAAIKARSLIGMTKMKNENDENNDIQTVPRENITNDDDDDDDSMGPNAVYNSEDYDTDERAEHLALGSLMLKKSTRSDLLDASYNRYAFNDPDELPAWFIEDESKHNRPQLPITQEMVDAVRSRFKDLTDKPIKKVAEARMRKKKAAQMKLESIKKKASAVVDAPDLTAKSKMRAIAKIYKGATIKRPNKLYVVSTKVGSGGKEVGKRVSGQGVKLVDARMKADKRHGAANIKNKRGKHKKKK